jgi:alpha-1,3-rhamnosyl/mannosyltransferase
MRVVVNRLSASGPLTGVGHYTTELCRQLQSCAADNSCALFPNALLWPGVRAARAVLPLIARMRNHMPSGEWGLLRGMLQGVRGVGRRVTRRARAELSRYIGATLSPTHFDLYHEPNFIPLPCDLPTAITVHDLSVLLFPQWHPAARVARYEKDFRAGLARSVFVFTPSKYVRFQVIQLLNVPPERVRCLYPGVRAGMRPLAEQQVHRGLRRLGLAPGFFLYVGAIEPRKNLLMLLQAYCALPASIRERHPLILAGPWGWGIKKIANYYETIARHNGVRHLGYIPDRTLPLLYNGARCLVYPSYYEGFGFPPVEMLACGGAVLASNIATLSETIGANGFLIAPTDADGWRSALMRAATDEPWLHALRGGAVQAASAYSWRTTAQQAWEAYGQILQPAPLPPAADREFARAA